MVHHVVVSHFFIGKKRKGGVKTPSYETDGNDSQYPNGRPRTSGRIWNPPLRWVRSVCFTVVGADSISARPGRRGRRPLRVILMLVAKVATPQSPSVTAPLGGEPLRADDEHRPLQYGSRGI